VVSAFALFGMLSAIGNFFIGSNRFSTNDRVFIGSKLGGSLPLGYVARVGALTGVRYGRADYGVYTEAYYRDQRNYLGPVPARWCTRRWRTSTGGRSAMSSR
jgi:hypothetical protein